MNFIILHGLEASSRSHWLPWLKTRLESRGHQAWVPDLPHPEKPTERIWTPFIIGSSPFRFDDNLVIIGWSAGAVEILHLLAQLDGPIHGTVLLAAFTAVPAELENESLSGMFKRKFEFSKIQQNGGKLIFMHGSDDPYCPLKDAQYLAGETQAQIHVISGAGHFSTDGNPRFNELPEILPIIEEVTIP